jgi:hypothetical protein
MDLNGIPVGTDWDSRNMGIPVHHQRLNATPVGFRFGADPQSSTRT